MVNSDYSILKASSSEQLKQVIALRKKVFVQEQGIPLELELDGKDNESLFSIATDEDNHVLACGRLTIVDQNDGIISRIAVKKEFRGKGIAREIVIHLEQLAKDKGLSRLTLKPHDHLHDFYSSLGYMKYGEIEYVGKHALFNMEKLIAK